MKQLATNAGEVVGKATLISVGGNENGAASLEITMEHHKQKTKASNPHILAQQCS